MLTRQRLISLSFTSSDTALTAAASDIFDIYRALLPTHFATQLQGVPTLAMQLYNDSLHLSARILSLHTQYPHWTAAEDLSRRMTAVGEHTFEEQLVAQRDALMGILDEADGFVDTGSEVEFKRCERAVKQVQYNLESLARVLKVCLFRSNASRHEWC